MEKVLDLKKSVFELVQEQPEIKDIMVQLGFDTIAAPGMLNTAGRFMTIPKGAQMKGVSLEAIKQTFENKGYKVFE